MLRLLLNSWWFWSRWGWHTWIRLSSIHDSHFQYDSYSNSYSRSGWALWAVPDPSLFSSRDCTHVWSDHQPWTPYLKKVKFGLQRRSTYVGWRFLLALSCWLIMQRLPCHSCIPKMKGIELPGKNTKIHWYLWLGTSMLDLLSCAYLATLQSISTGDCQRGPSLTRSRSLHSSHPGEEECQRGNANGRGQRQSDQGWSSDHRWKRSTG